MTSDDRDPLVMTDVTVRMVGGPDEDLLMTLAYSPAAPWEVRAYFHIGTEEPVDWKFARQLLIDGLEERAGAGDVMVWTEETREVTCIRLTSPFGDAIFEAFTDDIGVFVAETYALVPEGDETRHVDVDAALDELLRGAL